MVVHWSDPALDISRGSIALSAAAAGWRNRTWAGYTLSSGDISPVYVASSINAGASYDPGVAVGIPGESTRATSPIQLGTGNGWAYVVYQGYIGSQHVLFFNRCNLAGQWQRVQQLTGFVVNGASVAADEIGNVYIAYAKEYAHGTDNQVEMIASSDYGATWGAPVQLSDRHRWTDVTNLQIDAHGNLRALYIRGASGGNELITRVRVNGAWQAEETLFTGRAFWPVLKASLNGTVGVAWQSNAGGGSGINYRAWHPGSGWGSTVNIADGAYFYPALALDARGLACIAMCCNGEIQTSLQQPDGSFPAPTTAEVSRCSAPSMSFTGARFMLNYQHIDANGQWRVFSRHAPVVDAGLPAMLADVPGNIFQAAINRLYWLGAVETIGNNYFDPAGQATRGDFARAMVVGLGIAASSHYPHPSFSDVPPSNPNYPFIEAGKAALVLSGFPDSTFHPDAPITRAQVTAFVARAKNWAGVPGSPFPDVPSSNWAAPYIGAAVQHNVVHGYSDGTFQPNAPVRRDEMCQIVATAAVA